MKKQKWLKPILLVLQRAPESNVMLGCKQAMYGGTSSSIGSSYCKFIVPQGLDPSCPGTTCGRTYYQPTRCPDGSCNCLDSGPCAQVSCGDGSYWCCCKNTASS